MKCVTTRSRGQVTVEAAILFAFVIAALVAMSIYLQRAAAGGVKSNADSLGTQFSSNAAWNTNISSNTTETRTNITSNQSTNFRQRVN